MSGPVTDAGVAISGFSPWGIPESLIELAPGIWSIETASHGGFFIEAVPRSMIPKAWQDASFNGQGRHGWFEHDVDWALVAMTFPALFTHADMAIARLIFAKAFAAKVAA